MTRLLSSPLLAKVVAGLPIQPRVVASGNAATPWTLLAMIDSMLDEYVLHVLNPQPGVPHRDGVVIETPFVGPGARPCPSVRDEPQEEAIALGLMRS